MDGIANEAAIQAAVDIEEGITYAAVIAMLRDIEEDVDFETENSLVDDKVIDSFDIIAIVNAADEEFGVAIPAAEIVPANFNSARALHALIVRLADED